MAAFLPIFLLLLSCCHGDQFDEGIPDPVESEVEVQYGDGNDTFDTFDYVPVTTLPDRPEDDSEATEDVIDVNYDVTDTGNDNDASWRDWSRGSMGGDNGWSREQQRNRGRPGLPIVKVTTLLEAPYMMLRGDSPFLTGNDRFEGHLADMLSRLSRLLRFDYVIQLARDGKTGGPGKNGTGYTGILGEVMRKEADIGVGPLTVTDEWHSLVQFTEPFLSFRSTALIKKEKRKPRLHTAEELLYSGMKYGILQGSITQRLFEASTNATHHQMWSRMASFWPPPFVQSKQEGIERSRRENFAFIIDSPTAEYLATRRPCEFYTIEPFLAPREYAFIMNKDDDFIDTINEGLQQLYEMEEMQLLYLKWWMGECPIYNSNGKPRSRHVHRKHKDKQRTVSKRPYRPQPTASYFSSSECTQFTFSLISISLLALYL